VRTHGLTVLSGPFAGMRYPPFAVERGELIVAQLLGAYEMELHDAVRDVIARRPQQVVDIGASDGYYAAGFARALPEAVVHAYEMNPFPARVCAALARENGVPELTDRHWLVVRFMRERYLATGTAPTIRSIGKESGVPVKELYQLFPKGPAKLAAKIGGIPKPKGCI